jgi:polar amino acid transport system substrate-binding protein
MIWRGSLAVIFCGGIFLPILSAFLPGTPFRYRAPTATRTSLPPIAGAGNSARIVLGIPPTRLDIIMALLKDFAPRGKLRASINLGNPILANRDPASGQPVGVSVDLAHEFARRLGADIELTVFDNAGKSVDAVTRDEADIGFFAIDPLRGEGIHFSAAYVIIEGSYLVPADSPIRRNEEIDDARHRVAVAGGSAYDLHLTRELKHARIVRAPTSQEVVGTFLRQRLEVAAGVRPQLEAEAMHHPGLRLLPGRFMAINQAMGVPRSRGKEAFDHLDAFVEEMKRSGFVADALARHRVKGAALAPAASGA